jgi:outer membrane receptor protein involved in Fe transport
VHHRTGRGIVLRNRPKQRGSLTLQQTLGEQLQLNASWVHVGKTRDFSVPTGEVDLPAHDRVDMAVQRDLGRKWKLSLAIDNLLDRRAETYAGFVQPGRRARLELRGML